MTSDRELEPLIQRIRERMAVMRWSERETMRQAGVGENALRYMTRGHAPKPDTLVKLARALKVPPSYFLLAIAGDPQVGTLQMETVFVRGAVQAGVWVEAVEWEPADWIEISVPLDPRLPEGVQRHGLLVKGTSMNRLYPEGTILLCVRFVDIRRGPRTLDKVVVLRRSPKLAAFEATVKEYELDGQGRHVLWPRSFDPEFQAPIILPGGDAPVAMADGALPPAEFDLSAFHDAGADDLLISSLVIASYRDEAPSL